MTTGEQDLYDDISPKRVRSDQGEVEEFSPEQKLRHVTAYRKLGLSAWQIFQSSLGRVSKYTREELD